MSISILETWSELSFAKVLIKGRVAVSRWLRWEEFEPVLLETVAAESCPLFILLRHRTPSSPIYLSEVIRKPFALSQIFRLSSGEKSVLLVKKKALSLSGFLLPMHVVLKTRHVNPIIHVRRY